MSRGVMFEGRRRASYQVADVGQILVREHRLAVQVGDVEEQIEHRPSRLVSHDGPLLIHAAHALQAAIVQLAGHELVLVWTLGMMVTYARISVARLPDPNTPSLLPFCYVAYVLVEQLKH